MKTVSDHIFEILREKGMSQKELSLKTGISESTISDWKKKKNNPAADKLLLISEALHVDLYELLSGSEEKGSRTRKTETFVVGRQTDLGLLIERYQNLPERYQKRLLGYMEALTAMSRENDEENLK